MDIILKSPKYWMYSFILLLVINVLTACRHYSQDNHSSNSSKATLPSTWGQPSSANHASSYPSITNSSFQSTSTYGVPEISTYEANTPDDAYNEGYEQGYEDGKSDGKMGRSHGYSYDDTNDYYNYFETRYIQGYEEGYEEGYNAGQSLYEENDEDE